jgi:hypothetical protein
MTLVISKPGYATAMANATEYIFACGSTGPVPQTDEVNVRLMPR